MLNKEQKVAFRKAFKHTFDVLRENRIVSYPFLDICCGNCGGARCGREMENWGANGFTKLGYAFTHNQDRETINGRNWLDRGEIYVGYGGNADGDAEKVGKLIVDAAHYCGLIAEWSGSSYNRVLIKFPVNSPVIDVNKDDE